MARHARRAFFLATTALAVASPALAQTPMTAVSVKKEPDVQARQVSPSNPWVSAQVGYRFPGGGDPNQSFVVSARALYWLDKNDEPASERGWGLPVMGNFSGVSASTPPEELDRKLQEVASSAQGVYAGIYPYWRFLKTSVVSPTVYAGLVPFKANSVKVADGTTETLYQGNLSLGAEAVIGRKDGRSPLTVSLSGTYALPYNPSAFSKAFPNDEFQRWSGELTVVVPIANGLGILAEGVFPAKADPGFRAGLLFSAEIGGKAAGE